MACSADVSTSPSGAIRVTPRVVASTVDSLYPTLLGVKRLKAARHVRLPVVSLDVRFPGQSGHLMLRSSLSAFDPKLTSRRTASLSSARAQVRCAYSAFTYSSSTTLVTPLVPTTRVGDFSVILLPSRRA